MLHECYRSFRPACIDFPSKENEYSFVQRCTQWNLPLISDTGYMNSDLFIDWLKHFVKHAKPSAEDPDLLIADNHTSHCPLPAVLFCREIHITFLTLPPHASHVLQQLNRCFLAPLKALYSSKAEKWLVQIPGKVITIYEVSRLFQKAYSAISMVQLAEKAFRVTRIEPNNPDIISEDCYSHSLVTLPLLDNDCKVAVAPEENEVHLPLLRWMSVSSQPCHFLDMNNE
ncbi:hypothetical protein AVEN_104139-1 [Araneus ventricosus]|uniref:DDE-1 domain-containing protein n=1 Tax=Araneus ventricosus TaxID=182803 RepID=A0A4Y2I6W7_ARAVE|nr:hypothetical protein AVEN_104139-1 [Araneus ventricosus]